MTTDPAPTIRFRHDFLPQLRSGAKTMTTRTRPYGLSGDVLQVADENGVPQGFSIRLTDVRQVRLSDVATRYYVEEGFSRPSGFVKAWTGIYGRYDPGAAVYVHTFEVIDGGPYTANQR